MLLSLHGSKHFISKQMELILIKTHGLLANTGAPASTTQNASNAGRNAETFVHVATNTAPRGAAGSVNASTNTNLSTNAATNTSNSAGINTFTSTVHLPHTASQRSVATFICLVSTLCVC